MLAVVGSGMSSMSDASMPFQPAIDEPSNAWPEVNLSSSKCEIGTVTCCSLPRVSVKRKSTNLTSFSFTSFITSATFLAAIRFLLFLGLGYRKGCAAGMQVLCQKLVHGVHGRARGFCTTLNAFRLNARTSS